MVAPRGGGHVDGLGLQRQPAVRTSGLGSAISPRATTPTARFSRRRVARALVVPSGLGGTRAVHAVASRAVAGLGAELGPPRLAGGRARMPAASLGPVRAANGIAGAVGAVVARRIGQAGVEVDVACGGRRGANEGAPPRNRPVDATDRGVPRANDPATRNTRRGLKARRDEQPFRRAHPATRHDESGDKEGCKCGAAHPSAYTRMNDTLVGSSNRDHIPR